MVTATGTPEDDRITALINESRFPRSSSLTDSFIPPPPQTAPPPPPSASSTSSLFLLDSGPPPSFLPPPPPARGEGLTRSSFKPGAEPRLQELSDSPSRSHAHAERQRKARSMIILQDTPPPLQPDAHTAATHTLHTATHTATHTLHTATHTSTLSLHSTSPALGHSPLSRRRGRPIENPYANVGQQAPPTKPQRRKSPLLKQLPVEEQGLGIKDHDSSKLDGGGPGSPSRAELYQQQVLSERARVQGRRSSLFLSVEGAGSENQVPPLLTQSHSMDDLGELPPPAPVLSPSPTPHTFLHPLTGKPLDPSSPLALALAARERALTARTPSPEPRTKHASASTTPIPTPAASPEGRHKRTPIATPQSSPEPRSKRTTPQTSPEQRTKRTTPQTSPELRHKRITPPLFPDGQVERPETEGGVTSPAGPSPERWRPSPLPPLANESHSALIDRRRSLTVGSSEEEGGAYTVTLPPALLSSSDEETREELRRIGLVTPPPAFASPPAAPPPSSLTLLPRRAGEGGGGESGPESLGRRADEEEGGDERLHDSSSSPSSLPPSITLASPPAPSSPSSPPAAHPSPSSAATSPSGLKPRLRSPIGRGRSALRDPLLKQSSDSELLPSASSSSPSSPLCSSPTSGGGRQPRYLFQRRSKLWGGGDDRGDERRGLSPEEGGGRPAALGGQGSGSAVDLTSRSASALELSGRAGSGLDLANRLQLLNKDSHSLGEEPSPLDPGRRSPVGGARWMNSGESKSLFSSLGELHTISQRGYGASYTVRPGSRYPVTRRSPSPSPSPSDRSVGLASSPAPCSERPDLSSGRGLTILKSSSLSLPSEPKEVRFVMRSASARTRSRSPSPSPHASPCPSPVLSGPLLALRPWRQRPLNLWNKYDVGDWLESVGLAEHRQRFQEHEIEGSHLPALTKEDYVELGVTRLGHRINIERALRQLLDGST
uniref:SH3 and multiple ankyrin repeat domains 3 n=1 Tax=Lates calcarifer TaxID=8187 RepID=A0A4W6D0H9_LATCA